MKRFLAGAATVLLYGWGLAAAQIGEPPAKLRQSLASLNPVVTGNGFRAGGLRVALERFAR